MGLTRPAPPEEVQGREDGVEDHDREAEFGFGDAVVAGNETGVESVADVAGEVDADD